MTVGRSGSLTAITAFSINFLLVTLVLAGSSTGSDVDERWTVLTVGDMIEGRYNHTSTLLSDTGEVIAVGGTPDGYGSLSSAEIFDRETLSWKPASSMKTSRMRHTADEIEPGTLMVMGGFLGGSPGAHPSLFRHYNDTDSTSFSSTEIYEHGKDRWILGPDMLKGRFWHSTAVLPDGDILVIGGLNVTDGALSGCEIYDRSLGRFIPASPMSGPRVRCTVDVLDDGSVLVAGGHDGQKKMPFSSCEIYIPEEDRWIPAASMNRPRGYHSSALMPDGRVMVSGGFSSPTGSDWTDSEIYDPTEDKWTMVGNMSSPRHNHISVPAHDGTMFVMGGSNCETGMCHSSIESFDMETEEWQDMHLLMMGREWCRADMLPGGDILVSGGKACNYPQATTDMLLYSDLGEGGGSDADGGNGNGGIYLLVIFLAISFIMVNLVIKAHIRK